MRTSSSWFSTGPSPSPSILVESTTRSQRAEETARGEVDRRLPPLQWLPPWSIRIASGAELWRPVPHHWSRSGGLMGQRGCKQSQSAKIHGCTGF